VDEKVLNIVSNNYFSIENEFDSNASELQNPKAGPSHSLAKTNSIILQQYKFFG
jgi:hypothetical protein